MPSITSYASGPVIRRFGRLIVITAVALGLVATMSVDFAVAGQRRAHDRKMAAVRAERRAEQRYLIRLRGVAAAMFQAVQPVQSVVDAYHDDPHPGDIYAMRDALAGTENATSVALVVDSVAKLQAPAALRTTNDSIRAAASQLHADIVTATKSSRTLDVRKLVDQLDLSFGDNLARDELSWQTSLQSAFDRQHEAMPATPSTHAAGRVSAAPVGWVFGADRSCVDAEVASYPVLKRFEAGRFNPGDFTKLGGIFARLSKRLRHLAVPGADRSSIRFDIAGRLRVLDVASRDLDALGRALSRGDVSSADAAAGKLSSLDTVMNPLASLMRRHHVIACANLLGPGSGSGSGHGASGSSIAA